MTHSCHINNAILLSDAPQNEAAMDGGSYGREDKVCVGGRVAVVY